MHARVDELLPLLQVTIPASLDKGQLPDVPSVSGALELVDGRARLRRRPVHPLDELGLDEPAD